MELPQCSPHVVKSTDLITASGLFSFSDRSPPKHSPPSRLLRVTPRCSTISVQSCGVETVIDQTTKLSENGTLPRHRDTALEPDAVPRACKRYPVKRSPVF